MKRFFLTLAAVLVVFSACENEIPAEITIPDAESQELYNTGIYFSASKEGGVQTVQVSFTCTLAWSVTIEEITGDWLTVNPASGSAGPTTITVTAKDNTETQSRTAKITITCNSVSVSFKVLQAGMTTSENIPAESIELDTEEVHMMPGQTWQLNATVIPEEAVVTWSSSQTNVATVDQEGKVTAVALGETFIKATAGDKSAQCLVKVEEVVNITGISLNETSLTLKEGETFQLVATLLPETASPLPIEWISSIPAVATVDANGFVTAVKKGGPVQIWAIVKTGTGYEINANCEVTVTSDAPSIESITVSPAKVTVNATESTILTATVTPEGTGAVIEWFSDNTGIATVEKISDTQARVTGVGTGTTKVVARVGDVFDYSEVTVENKTSGGVESISLNKTELSLQVGESFQLVATILPDNATDKTVSWSMTAHSYELSMDVDGLNCVIGALADCEATITVRSAYDPGNIYATCHVTVTGGSSSSSVIEAVDLGLSVKWGSCNVGASKPEEYGDYYAWGETQTKSSYTWSNYKYGHSQNGSFSKYDTDKKTVLESEDDAATVSLGGTWRMATYSEWKELREKCSWKWTTRNGVNGMQVTGSNGNSIFLPAAGWYDTSITNKGTYGAYWTSTDSGVQGMASGVDFISGDKDYSAIARCMGRSIRPVTD